MARRRVTKPPRGRAGGFGRSTRGGPRFGRPRPAQFGRGGRSGRENAGGRRETAAAAGKDKRPARVERRLPFGRRVLPVPMDRYERWWRVLAKLKEKNKKTSRPIVLFYYRCVMGRVCVCFFPILIAHHSAHMAYKCELIHVCARVNCTRQRSSNMSLYMHICVMRRVQVELSRMPSSGTAHQTRIAVTRIRPCRVLLRRPLDCCEG